MRQLVGRIRFNEPCAIIIAATITGIFAVIAALIATGQIGSNNLPNQSPIDVQTTTPTNTPVPTTAQDWTGETLVIWTDETCAAALESLANRFEDTYGVNIEVQRPFEKSELSR